MPNRPMTLKPIRVQQAVNRSTGGRGSPSERGYDRVWRALRDRYIRQNPLCVMCKPLLRPGRIVDHVIPVHVAPNRRLDETNLQTLCDSHHTYKTITDLKIYGSAS